MHQQNNQQLPKCDFMKVLEALKHCATTAGQYAFNARNADGNDLNIQEKSGQYDICTKVDKENQIFIRDFLTTELKEFSFLGEEQDSWDFNQRRLIICDPIDGTWDYAHYGRNWGVIIGTIEDGQPTSGVLYQPCTNTLFTSSGSFATLNSEEWTPRQTTFSRKLSISVGAKPSDHLEKVVFPFLRQNGLEIEIHTCAISAQLSVIKGNSAAYIALGEKLWDVAGVLPMFLNMGKIYGLNDCELSWNSQNPPPFVAGFDEDLLKNAKLKLENILNS